MSSRQCARTSASPISGNSASGAAPFPRISAFHAWLAGARPEHHAFQQRIAGQAISAVDARAGNFAGRIEPRKLVRPSRSVRTPPIA